MASSSNFTDMAVTAVGAGLPLGIYDMIQGKGVQTSAKDVLEFGVANFIAQYLNLSSKLGWSTPETGDAVATGALLGAYVMYTGASAMTAAQTGAVAAGLAYIGQAWLAPQIQKILPSKSN